LLFSLQNEPEHITHDHPTNDFFSTMPPSSNTLTRSGLVQQGGTGQPATRTQSKSKGSDKPQPEAEGRSR
jgi:hypothetical protein